MGNDTSKAAMLNKSSELKNWRCIMDFDWGAAGKRIAETLSFQDEQIQRYEKTMLKIFDYPVASRSAIRKIILEFYINEVKIALTKIDPKDSKAIAILKKRIETLKRAMPRGKAKKKEKFRTDTSGEKADQL